MSSVVTFSSVSRSIATESSQKLIQIQLRANEVKSKIKALFKSIDQQRTGKIKTAAFLALLELHQVNLSSEDLARIKSTNGLEISYGEALAQLRIDLAYALLGDENWSFGQQSKDEHQRLTAKSLSQVSRQNSEQRSQIKSQVQSNKDFQASEPSMFSNKIHKTQPAAETRFYLRNRTDFPDYKANSADQQTGTEQTVQTQFNYIIELLQNDQATYDNLVSLSRLLAESSVELRTLSSLKSMLVDQSTGNLINMTFDVLIKELKGLFEKYPKRELLIDQIVAFLKKGGCEVVTFERVNTLVEFLQCYPLLIRKNKNASPDIEAVMNNKPKVQESVNSSHAVKLLEYIRFKIQERYFNPSHAFRFFDQRSKGRLQKIDFVHGLDQLGVRLSKDDLAIVWKHLDSERKGSLAFTDFCLLNELKSQTLNDPFTLRSLQTTIQDSLALERKAERDRIAKEFIDRIAGKDSSSTQQKDNKNLQKAYGIESLLSDNMNLIVQYDFNKEFLSLKKEREINIRSERGQKNQIIKNPRDNLANTVRRDKNIAFKLSLEEKEDSFYKVKEPFQEGFVNKDENVMKLPSVTEKGNRVYTSDQPSKCLQRAFEQDTNLDRLSEDFKLIEARLQPAFSRNMIKMAKTSQGLSQSRDTKLGLGLQSMRQQKHGILKDFLAQKQQVGPVKI